MGRGSRRVEKAGEGWRGRGKGTEPSIRRAPHHLLVGRHVHRRVHLVAQILDELQLSLEVGVPVELEPGFGWGWDQSQGQGQGQGYSQV